MTTDKTLKIKKDIVKRIQKNIRESRRQLDLLINVATDDGKPRKKTFTNDALGRFWVFYSTVSRIVENTPREDPLHEKVKRMASEMEELKKSVLELHEKMKTLSAKVNDGFNEMKTFISDAAFPTEFAEGVDRLTTSLKALLEKPSLKKAGRFLTICHKKTPRDYAEDLLNIFTNDATNWLKKAMEADEWRCTATFDKWKTFHMKVLTVLTILDVINNVIEDARPFSTTECVRCQVQRETSRLEVEYKRNFFPEVVRKIVEHAQDSSSGKINEQVGGMIVDALNAGLTDDTFYVITFDKTGDVDDVKELISSNETANMVKSTNRDGASCDVFVHRSKRGGVRTEKDLVKLKQQMLTTPTALPSKSLHKASNVALLDASTNPSIRSARSHFRWGPGWWRRGVYESSHVIDEMLAPTKVWIVGFD